MTVITREALLDAIKADYEEHGAAYIYERAVRLSGGCYYRTPVVDPIKGVVGSEGAAGCFVGRVLDRLGVLPPKLSTFRGDFEGPDIEGKGAITALSMLGITFEDDRPIDDDLADRLSVLGLDRLTSGMAEAQSTQDGGYELDKVVLAFASGARISLDDLGFTL